MPKEMEDDPSIHARLGTETDWAAVGPIFAEWEVCKVVPVRPRWVAGEANSRVTSCEACLSVKEEKIKELEK